MEFQITAQTLQGRTVTAIVTGSHTVLQAKRVLSVALSCPPCLLALVKESDVLNDSWVLKAYGIGPSTLLTVVTDGDDFIKEKTGGTFLTERAVFVGNLVTERPVRGACLVSTLAPEAKGSISKAGKNVMGANRTWWITQPSHDVPGEGIMIRICSGIDMKTETVGSRGRGAICKSDRSDKLELQHGRYKYIGQGKLTCDWESRAFTRSSVGSIKSQWTVNDPIEESSCVNLGSLQYQSDGKDVLRSFENDLNDLPKCFWTTNAAGFRKAAELCLEDAATTVNREHLEAALDMAVIACFASNERNDSRDRLVALVHGRLASSAPKRRGMVIATAKSQEVGPTSEEVAQSKKQAADKVRSLIDTSSCKGSDRSPVVPCLKALRAYISNVSDHPTEEKYRVLKMSGKAFSERVSPFPEAVELLEVCGFHKQDGEQLIFQNSAQYPVLWAAVKYLDVALKQLENK
jgi:hypothetical protein